MAVLQMLDYYFKGLGCPVGDDGEPDVDTYMGFPNARAEFVEIVGLQAFYFMGLIMAAATEIWDVKNVEVERDTLLKLIVNYTPSIKAWKAEKYFDAYIKEELLFQKRARTNGWELSSMKGGTEANYVAP